MARHISDFLVGLLCGESVKRFNLYAVQGLETDLRVIEGWAEKEVMGPNPNSLFQPGPFLFFRLPSFPTAWHLGKERVHGYRRMGRSQTPSWQ